ncbi:hypothetical protein QM565_31405 [Geitlerinema splendidum]|nr:hypothetical protein [Geitlerinema splendidum]
MSAIGKFMILYSGEPQFLPILLAMPVSINNLTYPEPLPGWVEAVWRSLFVKIALLRSFNLRNRVFNEKTRVSA